MARIVKPMGPYGKAFFVFLAWGVVEVFLWTYKNGPVLTLGSSSRTGEIFVYGFLVFLVLALIVVLLLRLAGKRTKVRQKLTRR
jgi:hypothetical protein